MFLVFAYDQLRQHFYLIMNWVGCSWAQGKQKVNSGVLDDVKNFEWF